MTPEPAPVVGVRARDLIKARLVLLLATLLAAACTDRDAPRPVPVPDEGAAADPSRPVSSREGIATAPPAQVDPDDPAEPGIPDLARLARYVYKVMQRHDQVCPFGNPFRDRLHFALEVEVRGGRMTRVGLGHVGIDRAGANEARPLAAAQWPSELESYVTCLAPHLQAVPMAPSPADGSYEPEYSYGGREGGRPGP
jgi:hypothetical protein